MPDTLSKKAAAPAARGSLPSARHAGGRGPHFLTLMQEAEEARARALALLDHHGDPVVTAQDLHSAGESYIAAAKAMTEARRG